MNLTFWPIAILQSRPTERFCTYIIYRSKSTWLRCIIVIIKDLFDLSLGLCRITWFSKLNKLCIEVFQRILIIILHKDANWVQIRAMHNTIHTSVINVTLTEYYRLCRPSYIQSLTTCTGSYLNSLSKNT